MKKILITMLLCTGCLDVPPPPSTGTQEQALCTEEDVGCQTLWLQNYTRSRGRARANQLGLTVTGEEREPCDAISCTITILVGGGDQLQTKCFNVADIEWCEFKHCVHDGDNGYTCHDETPPD
jgi:hypothetical protein